MKLISIANNKINSCITHSNPHLQLHLSQEHKVIFNHNSAVTKANQLSSIPGPADYNVNKPLPKSATIAQTKSKR